LRSSGKVSDGTGNGIDGRPGGHAQRRCGVGAAFLRSARADPQPPHGRQPATLRPRCAETRGDHPGRQEVGISLAEIGAALQSLPEGRTPTRDDWNLLSTAWRDGLDQKINQLKKLRDGLTDCIGCGCMSIDKCPLRNKGDRLAREGTGARRLLVER
jgi:hypothetical protein